MYYTRDEIAWTARRLKFIHSVIYENQAELISLGVNPSKSLGIGSNGVVYATPNPNIVVKVTSDITELNYFKTIKNIDLPFFVKVHDIFTIYDKDKEPFYVIIREAAIILDSRESNKIAEEIEEMISKAKLPFNVGDIWYRNVGISTVDGREILFDAGIY